MNDLPMGLAMILVAMEKEKGEAPAAWASPAWPQSDAPEEGTEAEAAGELDADAGEPDPYATPHRPAPKASGTMPKVTVPLPRTKTG